MIDSAGNSREMNLLMPRSGPESAGMTRKSDRNYMTGEAVWNGVLKVSMNAGRLAALRQNRLNAEVTLPSSFPA